MTTNQNNILNIFSYVDTVLFLIFGLLLLFFCVNTFLNSKKWKKVMGKTSNVNCVRRTSTTVYRRGVRVDTNNDCIMDLTYEVDSKTYTQSYNTHGNEHYRNNMYCK